MIAFLKGWGTTHTKAHLIVSETYTHELKEDGFYHRIEEPKKPKPMTWKERRAHLEKVHKW